MPHMLSGGRHLSSAGWAAGSLVLLVLFLQSYTLEHLLFRGSTDLTYPLGATAGSMALVSVLLKGRVRVVMPSDLAVLAFAMIVLVSPIIHGTDPSLAFRVVFGSILPYFLARLYILPDATVGRIVGSTALSVGTLYSILLLTKAMRTPWFGRVSLGGANPIAAAEAVGFGTVAGFVQGITGAAKIKWPAALAGLLCLTAQVMALGSRGSVAAVFVTLAIVVVLIPRLRRASLRLAIAAGLITMAIVVNGVGGAATRFRLENIIRDPSVVGSQHEIGRLERWSMSLETIAESPILGAGLGVIYSHNLFLEIGSAMGLIGLGAILLVLASVRWRRVVRASQRSEAVLLILSLFLFTFIYRQTSFALDGHKSMFAFLGLLVAMERNGTQSGGLESTWSHLHGTYQSGLS